MRKLAVLLLIALLCGGWTHGKSTHNGKLAQVALGSNGADYPFVNYMLGGGLWSRQNGTAIDVSNLNPSGFPSDTSNLSSLWQMQVPIPPVAEAGSAYTFDWVGYAAFNIPGTIVAVSGAGCAQSGVKVTGPSCSVTTTISAPPATVQLTTVGTGSPNPQLTQARFYLTANATQVANCSAGLANSDSRIQQCFNANFLAALADFGVIRFVNVMGGNSITTPNMVTHWANNTPLSWYSFGASYFPPSLITTNLVTSLGDGTDRYTLAFPSFSLADKAQVIANLNAQITVTTVNTNAGTTVASCASTCTLSFASVPANIVTGMVVGDRSQSSTLVIKAAAVVSAVGATSVTLTCATPCTNPLWANVGSGDIIAFSPMLNINSTGYIPLMTLLGIPIGGKGAAAGPISAQYTLFTYDAALGAYIYENQTSTASGMNAGWPPAVMVALANAVKAHPWYNMPYLSVDAPTDYVSNLAAFNLVNLSSGLIPRYEGPDEVWNYVYPWTVYADSKEAVSTDTAFDHDNWYGQVMSQTGQLISTAYGSPSAGNRPSKYWLVAGMSSADDGGLPTKGGSGQDHKVASPAYVSAGGSAAYNWITHVATTGYWNTAYFNTVAELGWAYWYANGGNASTLIGNYLAGASCVSIGTCPTGNTTGNFFSLPVVNTQYTNFASYVASYAGTATIGLTQYEGGNVQCLAGSTAAGSGANVTTAGCGAYPYNTVGSGAPVITAFTPGSPTVMTITNNAYNYICNTASLCTGSAPTGTISGTGCAALDGHSPAIQSATATTITVNLDSTGCSTSAAGHITYDGATTAVTGYVQAFQYAAMQSTQLTPFELTNLQNFFTAGGVFPSEYDLADATSWGKYSTDIYATSIPVITAVQQYNAAP